MPARRQLALACLIFFTIGWVSAALGPALPDLARRAQVNLALAGGVIAALFVGALLAQGIGGALHDRWGVRPLLTVGLATLLVGLLGVILSHSIALTLLFGVIMGLGHGAADIGVSLFIALTFERAGVAALNFTNIFFGLGAIAGPAAASVALAHGGTALPALWGVAGIAVIAFVFALLARTPVQAHGSAPAIPGALPNTWWRSGLIGLLGGLFLLYVGLENGLGSWTTVLAQRVAGQSLATGALLASAFWFALTGGRVVASVLGTRVTARRLLVLCAVGAAVGAALLLASPLHPVFLVAGIVILGLCFGPIYPTAVALTTARFPATPGRATSLVTSLGSLGGVIIPWAQGWLLIQMSPWASILFIAGLVALMGGAILSVKLVGAP